MPQCQGAPVGHEPLTGRSRDIQHPSPVLAGRVVAKAPWLRSARPRAIGDAAGEQCGKDGPARRGETTCQGPAANDDG